MDLRFVILLLAMILGNPALAQYGVSNQRDGYGNLVRDQGTLSQTGVNQSTPNGSGAIRNPPAQRPINPTVPKQQQINRLGAGAN
jgi:hypothetical protein